MASQIDICNIALSRINKYSISSIDQSNEEARQCKIFWDVLRQNELRKHFWNFAMKTIALGQTTETRVDWGYIYSYPSDCIRPKYIFQEGLPNTIINEYEVAISSKGHSRVICCNIQNAYLKYTYNVQDATVFDPSYANALAYLLASELAIPLTNDQNLATGNYQKYLLEIQNAKLGNAIEKEVQLPHQSSFINARG